MTWRYSAPASRPAHPTGPQSHSAPRHCRSPPSWRATRRCLGRPASARPAPPRPWERARAGRRPTAATAAAGAACAGPSWGSLHCWRRGHQALPACRAAWWSCRARAGLRPPCAPAPSLGRRGCLSTPSLRGEGRGPGQQQLVGRGIARSKPLLSSHKARKLEASAASTARCHLPPLLLTNGGPKVGVWPQRCGGGGATRRTSCAADCRPWRPI